MEKYNIQEGDTVFFIETEKEDVVNVLLNVTDGSIKEDGLAKWLKESARPK